MARRGFGQIRKLPSGSYHARYQADATGRVANAPTTFRTKASAEAWLARERVRLENEAAGAPVVRARETPTFSDYADRWLAERPLRPTTARTYRNYIERHARPVLGPLPLDKITPDVVRRWYEGMALGAPTARAQTYSLVRTILGTAIDEDLIDSQPCRLRGAGSASVKTEVITATPDQVEALRCAMPPRMALAILLGAWCQLRIGEALALRRRDIDLNTGVVHVRRGVTWPGGEAHIGPTKTAAGLRDVHMPSTMLDAVRAHLALNVERAGDALLFPSQPGSHTPVHQSWFARRMKAAVRTTDLPETFRYHHLRHTGLTLLAQRGASVAELQARAGHATPGIALRYQHASAERDRALAERLA